MIQSPRSILLLSALILPSCGDAPTHRAANVTSSGAAADLEQIACALGGSPAFAPVCTVETVRTDAALTLIARQPDGRFHRLLVTRDGRGVIAADGAEAAQVSIDGGSGIEVAIGGDRYRLPATVKPRP